MAVLTCLSVPKEKNAVNENPWPKEIMQMAGLTVGQNRAAEISTEASRISAGVARVANVHFGFYDEPIQFLAALEDLAEEDH